MLIHHDEILDWLNKTGKFSHYEDDKPEPKLYRCPKFDKCIMECYHKKPHEYDARYCNDLDGECGVKCVHELISDCTFFDEDFEV
jgi:hypothetical protein